MGGPLQLGGGLLRSINGGATFTKISGNANDTLNNDGDALTDFEMALTVVATVVSVAADRAMVDAGADLFVGHGPHVLRGIEIYQGKPIFYSLGDFMFQNETVLRLPDDNYRPYRLAEDAGVADFNDARYARGTRGFPTQREIWESVVAVAKWRGDQLTALELHPITLGFGQAEPVRGRPMLADRELGRKIIGDLIERSRPFGTTIEWRDGIGVVKLPLGTAAQGAR